MRKCNMKSIIRIIVTIILLAITVTNMNISSWAIKTREYEWISRDDAYKYTYHLDDSVTAGYNYLESLPVRSRSLPSFMVSQASWSTNPMTEMYEWMFGVDVESRVDTLLTEQRIPAVVVRVLGIDDHLQYVSENNHAGLTFRKVEITQVLRNPEEDAELTVGNTIYLKESYFKKQDGNGTLSLYCDYKCYQKPLINDKEYIVFLYDLFEYDIVSPPSDDKVYAFDERCYWNYTDRLEDSDTYYRFDSCLFADYHTIQYEYFYKVAYHFGLLEGQGQPPADTPTDADSNYNIMVIIFAVTMLLALAILSYGVYVSMIRVKKKSKE